MDGWIQDHGSGQRTDEDGRGGAIGARGRMGAMGTMGAMGGGVTQGRLPSSPSLHLLFAAGVES